MYINTMEVKGKKRQLYERLEALVSCPKCKKTLEINNYICGSGHTICKICTNGATICVLCNAPYTNIQNLIAQRLILEFDDIKECLTTELNDTELKSNKSSGKVEKKCDLLTTSKDELSSEQYRCWITNECKFIGHYSAIIKHLKASHVLEFDELLNGSFPYSNFWEMKYSIGNYLNRAFNIGGLLFIVHLSINEDEELCACIIMYTGHSLAFRHSCRIEIECNNEKLTYKKGKVLSAQSSEGIILQLKRNIIHITQNKPLYNALKKKQRFKCSILIEKRANETVTDGKKRTITTTDLQRTVKNTNKQQSTVSNNELVISNKSNLKLIDNQRLPKMPMNKLMQGTNKFPIQKYKPHESYVYNQPLYPNIAGHHLHEGSSNVNNNISSSSMINNNCANAPSAPEMYERPPPCNPYFNKYRESMSINAAEATATEEENNEKCIMF